MGCGNNKSVQIAPENQQNGLNRIRPGSQRNFKKKINRQKGEYYKKIDNKTKNIQKNKSS